MPAAAVIPAPIAYIKFVAVKKLVVEFQVMTVVCRLVCTACLGLIFWETSLGLIDWVGEPETYREQIRVFKASLCLNVLAWNNRIGHWFYFVGLRTNVMINRDSWGH